MLSILHIFLSYTCTEDVEGPDLVSEHDWHKHQGNLRHEAQCLWRCRRVVDVQAERRIKGGDHDVREHANENTADTASNSQANEEERQAGAAFSGA